MTLVRDIAPEVFRQRLLVEGRLQYDEWEKEGQRHSRLRIVADRTQFMPSGSAS